MKLAKVIAAAAICAALALAAGTVAGAIGDPGRDAPAAPSVTQQAREEAAPGRSLGELAGPGGAGGKAPARAPGLPQDAEVIGPACLEEGAALSLQGHTLTVHGDLTLGGTLALDGGRLVVTGSFIVENGLLVMTRDADAVEVGGAMIAAGGDETGSLTAGRVTVLGDFLQLSTYSACSYNETGSHSTALGGADRLVQFSSPLGSSLRNPAFAPGMSFTSADRTIQYQYTYRDSGGSIRVQSRTLTASGGTFLSLSSALAADFSITAPNLYYTGDQGGRSLTVNGGLTVPQGDARALTGNWYATTITVAGALTVPPGRELRAAGQMLVTGALTLNAGAAAGDVDAYGEVNIAGGGLTVSGSYRRHAAPEERSLTASAAGSPITVTKDSGAQFAVSGPEACLSGWLGGRRVSVAGDLTVAAGTALDMGSGRLDVGGGMTVLGGLTMAERAAAVVVNGRFTWGESAAGNLTDGYLALAGDFRQAGGGAFRPAGSHRTLFCGAGAQSIAFDNPGGSSFANVYSLNPGVDALTLPAAGEKANTGIGLSGLSVDGNGALALYPGFGGGASAFEAVVPEDTAAVTVTPAKAHADGVVTLRVGGQAQGGVISVPQDRTTAVEISAASAAGEPYALAGAPFSAVYTLTLQPENSKLASPGFAYPADRPFDPLVTDYAVTVPVKDEQLTFSPALANPNASFAFVCGGQRYGGAAFTQSIAPGQTIGVDVVVTAYVNPTVASPVTRTYRLAFRRQTLLDGIALSGGAALNEPFSWDRAEYTADIPAAVWAVTAAPQKGDGCASCTLGGAAADSAELRPDFGGSARAEFTLSDATGTYRRTYAVTVRRPALLSNIPVSAAVGPETVAARLTPAFSSAVHAYEAIVPVNASDVAVSGDKVLPGCTGLTVGGRPDAYHPAVAPGGWEDVALTASAGDAPEQKATYTVRVGKPLVSDLAASAGSFTSPFHSDPSVPSGITLNYTEPSVVLTPMANDRGAGLVAFSYDEGGAALGSGANVLVALAQGQTRTITVRAVYQGIERQYMVAVYREKSDNANLKSLGAASGWLSPAFSPDTLSYTLLLPEIVSSVKLSPARADANATYRIGKLAANKPATISLALNKSSTLKITVTALRGNTKTYTVTVRRKAMLPSFSATPVQSGYPSLSPGGTDRMKLTYTLSMPCTVKLLVRKGGRWYTVLSRAEAASGARTYTWNGKVNGSFLGAGTYIVRIVPYWHGKAGTQRDLRVRILGKPGVSVPYLSPASFKANGAGKLTVKVKWTRLCDVKAEIVTNTGSVVKQLYWAQNRAPATKTLTWDGRDSAGALVPAGTYRLKVTCGGAAPVYKTFTVKR